MALVETFPPFLTVETDDPRAKMEVPSVSHSLLKENYEARLPEAVRPLLKTLEEEYGGPVNYRLVNYEGTETFEGPGNRHGDETGGLKVLFANGAGEDVASVWMRGSGTEPLFRVLADCAGTRTEILDALILWQRREVAIAAGTEQP
jgi:phosphoglucomutase